MKTHLSTTILLLTAIISLQAQNTQNLIPYPKEITPGKGTITLQKGISITTNESDPFIATYLQKHLNTLFDFDTPVTTNGNIELKITPNTEKEAYTLEIKQNRITIQASDHSGLFYGVQTLLQMFPPQIYGTTDQRLLQYTLPQTTIKDSPRFPYRGFMLDCSRTFFDTEYIKHYINWMAYHKLNTFQWNLSDDNGWRIEIKKYPILTEKGAWRGKNEILKPIYNSGNARYGGYYTQKEIKEIITYAAQRGITIIPEIDLPGHAHSLTACFPEMLCGTTTTKASACGEYDNVVCVAREENYRILDNIIKEIAQLFPSEYINIAGDEVIFDYWAQCEHCQALMKKQGYTDAHQLMGYFFKRMETIIEKHGKKMTGWDDIQDHGGLNQHSQVVVWRGFNKARESVSKGHPTIMQPAEYCYLDMKHTPAERGHQWAATIPTERIYNFDPVKPLNLTTEQEKLIIGTQCGIFAELLTYPPRFSEHQVFPRMSAFSEVAWSDTTHRNFQDFHQRLTTAHYNRLFEMGIAFRVEPPQVTYQNQTLQVTLPYPSAVIRYTLDGTEPTANSPVYQGQIITNTPENFRFSTFFGTNLHSIAIGASNIPLHHYLTPKVTINTDIPFLDKIPKENLTTYDFTKVARTNGRIKAGQHLTYTFDEPVECTTITISTGLIGLPIYGVSDGYVEYSHDGTTFIKGDTFLQYEATIKNITKPIKAVRITITDTNDGWQCNFQNLKIE